LGSTARGFTRVSFSLACKYMNGSCVIKFVKVVINSAM
jgi:hypothetical protein